MADFDAEFLFAFSNVQGNVDSIPQEVFFDVSAPKTSPLFVFSPTTGNSITRTGSIQVDVTDDLNALGDVTIYGVLADGSSELIFNGATFESLFSGGAVSDITGGKRYVFAYGGFGWPTTAVTIHVKAVDPVGATGSAQASYTISNPPTAPTIGSFVPATAGSQTRTGTVQVDITDAEGASALPMILITAITDDGTRRRVATGGTFHAPFTAGSSRSSITDGYRYIVDWDDPGWPTTGATLLVEAMNNHGLLSSVTWTATITNPPAAPVVSFSPSSGGSMTRADTVQIDVTDDEGASALSLIRIYAITADGAERLVAAGATIKVPFTAGSSRSSISNGYSYEVAWDAPGWPSTTAGLRVDVVDAQGRVTTSSSWTATITDPPAPPDVTQPTVTIISPTPPGPIGRNDPVKLQVTDVGGLRRVKLYVTMGDEQYVVHNGYSFRTRYVVGSTMTAISGGFEYVLLRSGGWLAAPTFEVYAIDTAGNER